MVNKIAVKRVDGGVSIIIPTKEATPELMLRDALRVEGYISHREILDEHLPEDRYFRNAWTDDLPTETIDIDYQKAVELKKDYLRVDRTPLLDSLDLEYMKADEQEDIETKRVIATKKQELRDITKLEMPTDLDALKEFIPDALKVEIPPEDIMAVEDIEGVK